MGTIKFDKRFLRPYMSRGLKGLPSLTHYNQFLMILHYPWLRWKVNSSVVQNMWKSEKVHFLELQVQQAISQTLYEPGTLGFANSNHYNQYLMILHKSQNWPVPSHGFLKRITNTFDHVSMDLEYWYKNLRHE